MTPAVLILFFLQLHLCIASLYLQKQQDIITDLEGEEGVLNRQCVHLYIEGLCLYTSNCFDSIDLRYNPQSITFTSFVPKAFE